MPRKPRSRLVVPGLPHHVWFRGNNRRRIFSYAHEFKTFLQLLHKKAAENDIKTHAFSLLPNHGHLLLTPADSNSLSRCMGAVLRRYAWLRNQRRGASGKLFEERFCCRPVTTNAYLATITAYIDLNPIRANLEQTLGAYRWSSCALHLNLELRHLKWTRPIWQPSAGYMSLGSNEAERARRYRSWLEACLQRDKRLRYIDACVRTPAGSPTEKRPGGVIATL